MLSLMPRRLINEIAAMKAMPTTATGNETKADRYSPPKARAIVAAEARPEAITAKATMKVTKGRPKARFT